MKAVTLRVLSIPVVFSFFLYPSLSFQNPTPSPKQQQMRVRPETLNALLDLRFSEIQSLEFVSISQTQWETELEIEGQIHLLRFRPHSMRSDSFQVLVQSEIGGPLVPAEAPPIYTIKGELVGVDGSQVRGSFREGRLTASIITASGSFGVQALADLGFSDPSNRHVVYRDSDYLNTPGYRCGAQEGLQELDPQLPGGQGVVLGTGLKVADIAADADFEFYQLNGSSVANTVNDIENVLNTVEARYEVPGIGITYEVTTIVVRTVSGAPYTSNDAGVLLCQFRSEWNSGANPYLNIQRDLAELFTGKNLIAPVIGIAWLGVVCNISGNDFSCSPSGGNMAYSVVESRFTSNFTQRVALSAHEIGHNWNATHCDGCASCSNCCRIMCSSLGGCTGLAFLTSFGCVEEGQILSFKNSRGCLNDLLDPQTIPFFDDFPSSALDTAKWSYTKGGTINSNAANEPSATLSLNLNSTGSALYQDDELRSNFILMGGQPMGNVSYFVERVGVESGEQLFVEYWANNLRWNLLNTITSDGVDQTNFVAFQHNLPGDALHNEFRIRFRAEGNQADDNWYLDNVQVSADFAPVITQQPSSQSVCQSGMASFTVSAIGSPAPTYQWKKNGVNIGGATSTTYTIPSAVLGDAANYTCLITNSLGNVTSDAAALTVLTNASCQDGVFCNGVETCSGGECVSGSSPCTEVCNEGADACQPFGEMSCELSSPQIGVGGTVALDILLKQVLDLKSYQAKINIQLISGSGSLNIDCPDGVQVDQSRPDYVFANTSNITAPNCSNASFQAASFTSVEVPLSPVKYLGDYSLTVDPSTAVGSIFEISIHSGETFLSDSGGSPINFTIGAPCVLTVSACGVYGDIAQPQNGIVNLDDILCVLQGFASLSNCPLGDLAPCGGNGAINLDDILGVLNAFAGSDPCCGG